MEIRELDFSNCKCILDLHKEIKTKLEFPEHYGMNWSALWDCLWEYYDFPVFIKINGFNSLSYEFSSSKEKIIEILERLVIESNGFSYEIIS